MHSLINSTKHIVLLGMMGSGKTYTGKKLAAILRRRFVDIDSIIENKTKTTISEIFASKGEEFFRDLEFNVIAKYCTNDKSPMVISIGGGAFSFQRNIDIINNNCISVFLNTDISVIIQRLIYDSKRPLLKGLSDSQKMDKIHNIFQSRYEQYIKAHITINIDSNIGVNILNSIIIKEINKIL